MNSEATPGAGIDCSMRQICAYRDNHNKMNISTTSTIAELGIRNTELEESTWQELLDIDGTSYRLRGKIELLESFDKIRCKTCETLIAKRSDMIVMSSDGPLGAYANPHGFVHEVMTLFKTQDIAVKGSPVKQYSWFPGYAWSIAECVSCGTQLGWYFTATKKKLKPQAFWGIRSSQVVDDTVK